jgi:hypothetical protein
MGQSALYISARGQGILATFELGCTHSKAESVIVHSRRDVQQHLGYEVYPYNQGDKRRPDHWTGKIEG